MHKYIHTDIYSAAQEGNINSQKQIFLNLSTQTSISLSKFIPQLYILFGLYSFCLLLEMELILKTGNFHSKFRIYGFS